MAETIGNLLVRIGADTSSLRKGLVDSKRQVNSFSSKVKKSSTALVKYGAAASAAGAAIGATFIAKTLGAIDAQAKLAQQLNTSSASMATLERAGGLAGVTMDKIATAGRQLDVALGRAAQGGNAQAKVLKRLALSSEHLASIPLDQRIDSINLAIKKYIPAAEQASVAAELFGTRNASAIMMLESGVLKEAAHQAKLFGVALSDIDAAKVEMANDAMSGVQMRFDGLIKQVTIRLAPILKKIADEFMNAANSGETMGERIDNVFERIIDGTAFVVNAIDGIKRAFKVVADTVITFFSAVAREITDKVANILEGLQPLLKLAKVDASETIESLRGLSVKAAEIADEAWNSVNSNLERPLAGDAFRDFIAKAKIAGEAAAEAAVSAREAAPGGGAIEVEDEGGESVSALQAKLDQIRNAHKTELELLSDKFAQEQEIINAAKEAGRVNEQEWNLLFRQQNQAHHQEMTSIEEEEANRRKAVAEAEARAKKKILGNALSSLTTLMNSESRKMFEIGKAAAISQSMVSTYTGMTKALELGWPLGPIAAGAIGLAGFANVQSIRSQSFKGGGGASGSTTEAVNASASPVQSSAGGTLTVTGLDANSLFTGDSVSKIAEELLEYQRNGGQVVLVA